jgi:hypothetical protein
MGGEKCNGTGAKTFIGLGASLALIAAAVALRPGAVGPRSAPLPPSRTGESLASRLPAPAPAEPRPDAVLLSARAPLRARAELLVRPAAGVEPSEIARRFDLVEGPADPLLSRIGFAIYALRREGSLAPLLGALRSSGLVFAADANLLARGAGGCCEVRLPESPDREIAVPGAEALRAAAGTGSRDVLVALLDSGVDLDHPDLAPNLVPGWDFVENDPVPQDENGHGTAVAGVIAARQDGRGAAGVCPEVSLMPVRVADERGEASIADLARGLVFAADRGARVIVVPLGAKAGAAALEEAVRYAVARGALVVAAAGNDSVNHELFPAAYPECLSVGAAGPGAELAFRTALAPGIDVFAPGERLPTTWIYGRWGGLGGTSAAAAYVGGLAALFLSRDPRLDARALAQALREGARPIAALERARDLVRAGRLDPLLALARARPDIDDLAVESVEAFPRRPLPGERTMLRARVRNAGSRPVGGALVRFALEGATIGEVVSPALDPGARAIVEAAFEAPRAEVILRPWTVSARAIAPIRDDDPSNDEARASLSLARRAATDLAIARIELRSIDLARGAIEVRLEIENRGNLEAAPIVEARDSLGTALVEPLISETLVPGAREEAIVEVRLAEGAPRRPGRLEVSVRAAGAEDFDPDRNRATFDWSICPLDPRPVKPQYQQSADIDLIADAPWRVRPLHPYVPVLLYVAAKGDPHPSTVFVAERFTLSVRDDPLVQGGRTIYDDQSTVDIAALPSRWPAGLEILEENGLVVTTSQGAMNPNIFEDRGIDMPGRYAILRVPRDAFQVPAQPAAPAERFLDARLDWKTERPIFWYWTQTRSGTYRKTMRIQFADRDLAKLPGEGRAYDAHVHTIAEWYIATGFDPLAPQKAYGGPIPMLKEAALATGLTGALDDVFEKVITTDHSCFYEMQEPNSDAVERRPPFGPTSPAASRDPSGILWTEFARMRGLFGRTAAEEVAFSQVSQFGIVPAGAHLLAFRAEHIEEPWHGGSALAQSLGEPRIVELAPLLARLAKSNPAENAKAFVYSAHPYSVQGWLPQNIAIAMGLGPHRGSTDFTTLAGDDFLVKGHQLWNGRPAHVLPNAKIDFSNVDPWRDPDFRAGNPLWDKTLVRGLQDWHVQIADLLDYEIASRPGIRFPRKLYVAGGTDAHGDFNLTEDRLAANIPFSSTFDIDSNAFGSVRTYVFSEEKPGATAEERAIEALADGNTVVTDGPLVDFAIDAEGRFSGARLQWHDRSPRFEDRDGRIGGGGAFDGERTALVVARNREVFFGYRIEDAAEGGSDRGAVRTIKIYRDRPGEPNPSRPKHDPQPASGTPADYRQPIGVGSLPVAGTGTWLSERIDPAEEGLIERPTAFSLGAFTGTIDPDVADLPPDERRCYTNPVYVTPVETQVAINAIDAAKGEIPAGGLVVRYSFGQSMLGRPYEIELKALDNNGESTDRSQPPITRLLPLGTWSANGAVQNSVYSVTNERAIPLNVFRYPGPNDVTFVVYFKEPPQDAFGNALNPLAFTFTTQGIGTGGGYGVAPVKTGGSGRRGGGSGGGGCAALPGADARGALFDLLMLAGLVAARGRWRRAFRRTKKEV